MALSFIYFIEKRPAGGFKIMGTNSVQRGIDDEVSR